LDPTTKPFTFHWKEGLLPPLIGVAVKVTGRPRQAGFEEAEMDMLTGTIGFTVIETVLDVAGLFDAQV
jgi:hypothetical protein